jgi:PAS domain S-box-containing protein
MRDSFGTVIAASQISRDITEQKRARMLVRESEGKLRAFLESAAQGVVTIDPKGRIDLVNAKMVEIFGYSREELIGQSLEILLPQRFHDVHASHRALYFHNPHPRPMGLGLDLAGVRKDGTEFPVEIALSYVPAKEGPIAIAFVNDVSERRKTEEQLRHTQKLESLGVLAGGVAHDFNNLLTGILGNCSLALDSLPATDPTRELLRSAIGASERAADLTRQLLAYAGKGRFVTGPVDLSALVRDMGQLLESSIPRSVQLCLELASGLPPIDADTSQLQQIVMNLVANGAEAVGEDKSGTVLVTTGVEQFAHEYLATTLAGDQLSPGVYVTLEVHDTGCGMDDAVLPRIFDPFFSTKFLGRGLGLAAVQGIVHSHKGTMKVSSEPGKGSIFKVLFPALPEPAAHTRSAGTLPGEGTILVIDDERVVRQAARAILERHGYTVLLAENGADGIDLFRIAAGRVSLVILDMSMPGMTGEETLKQLKLINEEVPVILSSGFNEAVAVRRFTGKDLAGFIQKPYSAATVAKRVKEILKARSASQP